MRKKNWFKSLKPGDLIELEGGFIRKVFMVGLDWVSTVGIDTSLDNSELIANLALSIEFPSYRIKRKLSNAEKAAELI